MQYEYLKGPCIPLFFFHFREVIARRRGIWFLLYNTMVLINKEEPSLLLYVAIPRLVSRGIVDEATA